MVAHNSSAAADGEFIPAAQVSLQRGQWYLARVREGVDFAPTEDLVMPRPWKALARGPREFSLAQGSLYVDQRGIEVLGDGIYGYASQLEIGQGMSEDEVRVWLREFNRQRCR